MNILSALRSNQKGNAVVIVLVVLVVVAVGALAYLSGQMAGEKGDKQMSPAQVAANADGEQQKGTPIKPGNPVVAKVGKTEIKRQEVFELIQTLPVELRQRPIGEVFPIALDQLINARIIEDKTEKVNLDKDPEVKKLLSEAKKRIVQTVFVQNAVNKKITDERLQEAYKVYVQNFPDMEEIKAAHILVDDEAKAKQLIKELNDGADFAALARVNSKDNTAEKGGELGYFVRENVVPEFAEAAFALEPGTYTKKPVKSQFGYHIILAQEKRMRPAADFEQVKPLLEQQLRQALLQEVIVEWRGGYDIETFDINGEEIKSEAPAPEQNAG